MYALCAFFIFLWFRHSRSLPSRNAFYQPSHESPAKNNIDLFPSFQDGMTDKTCFFLEGLLLLEMDIEIKSNHSSLNKSNQTMQ